LRSADRITAGALLAFAVAFSAGALRSYSWWDPGGPGSAFVPFWLGLVMAFLAAGFLIRSLRQKDPGEAWFPRGAGLRNMLVVLGATIVFVVVLKYTGMILGTALYLVALIGFLGRHRWWVAGAVALAAAGFNWLVFVYWLRVPFPEGLLGF
jgi:hypothetical protein